MGFNSGFKRLSYHNWNLVYMPCEKYTNLPVTEVRKRVKKIRYVETENRNYGGNICLQILMTSNKQKKEKCFRLLSRNTRYNNDFLPSRRVVITGLWGGWRSLTHKPRMKTVNSSTASNLTLRVSAKSVRTDES